MICSVSDFARPFALSGMPRQVIPLVLGYEPIAESMSLRGGDPSRFLLEPVTGAIVAYDDGWALVDGGFDLDALRDPTLRAARYDYESYTAVVPPGDALAEGVEAAGLEWSDLGFCAISHVHLDHTGALRLVPNGTPVALQRREWDWLKGGAGHSDVVVPADILQREIEVVLLDGDTVLAPGFTALDTRGHTPGHQSFRIDLPGRSIVLACDAADLERNLTERIPCGWTAVPGDEEQAARSLERLADLTAEPGVEVWPGHDPAFREWMR